MSVKSSRPSSSPATSNFSGSSERFSCNSRLSAAEKNSLSREIFSAKCSSDCLSCNFFASSSSFSKSAAWLISFLSAAIVENSFSEQISSGICKIKHCLRMASASGKLPGVIKKFFSVGRRFSLYAMLLNVSERVETSNSFEAAINFAGVENFISRANRIEFSAAKIFDSRISFKATSDNRKTLSGLARM